jgi:predicted Rdx family selenoprotein
MTGSSPKLLQIQGKWCWERKQKKTKPEAKKIQKLFYTLLNMFK